LLRSQFDAVTSLSEHQPRQYRAKDGSHGDNRHCAEIDSFTVPLR
jgi:hypothetical protein